MIQNLMAYEIPKLLTFEHLHHMAFTLKEDYNFFSFFLGKNGDHPTSFKYKKGKNTILVLKIYQKFVFIPKL